MSKTDNIFHAFQDKQSSSIAPVTVEVPPKRKPADEANGGGAGLASSGKKSRLDTSKDDLFDAHDFDIEIDVGATLAPTPSAATAATATSRQPPPATPSIASQGTKGPKRSLNLSDYKKKRGLI
jgi:hypothetical protein